MINNISNLFQIIYKNARPEEIATEEPNTYKNCFMCDFELLESTQFPHRFGQPKEFAELAVHIVENTYLNGETIRLDSGMRMKPR